MLNGAIIQSQFSTISKKGTRAVASKRRTEAPASVKSLNLFISFVPVLATALDFTI